MAASLQGEEGAAVAALTMEVGVLEAQVLRLQGLLEAMLAEIPAPTKAETLRRFRQKMGQELRLRVFDTWSSLEEDRKSACVDNILSLYEKNKDAVLDILDSSTHVDAVRAERLRTAVEDLLGNPDAKSSFEASLGESRQYMHSQMRRFKAEGRGAAAGCEATGFWDWFSRLIAYFQRPEEETSAGAAASAATPRGRQARSTTTPLRHTKRAREDAAAEILPKLSKKAKKVLEGKEAATAATTPPSRVSAEEAAAVAQQRESTETATLVGEQRDPAPLHGLAREEEEEQEEEEHEGGGEAALQPREGTAAISEQQGNPPSNGIVNGASLVVAPSREEVHVAAPLFVPMPLQRKGLQLPVTTDALPFEMDLD